MDVYERLGVTPIINAAGTLTHFGGSLMYPEVTDAMAAASRAFVDMHELHQAAGKRIADLLGVEAAHVCNGAAAGIALMAAACLTGSDDARIAHSPNSSGMRNEFIIQRAHLNPFAQALRLAGGKIVAVGTHADELSRALSERTAAVFYTFAWFCAQETLPLPQVVTIAGYAGVPVLVDTAAEIPPGSKPVPFCGARSGSGNL